MLVATWLRAAAGPAGLRETFRRVLWRMRWVPPAREASEILDGLDSGGRLIASGRTLVDALGRGRDDAAPGRRRSCATGSRRRRPASAPGVAAARARLAAAPRDGLLVALAAVPRPDAVRARLMATARRRRWRRLLGCRRGVRRHVDAPQPPPRAVAARRRRRRTCARSRASASATADTRAAGTPGYDESVDYVAGRLRRRATACGSRTSPFPVFRDRSAPRLEVGAGGCRSLTLRYSPPGRVRAPVARVGPRAAAPRISRRRAAGSRSPSAGRCTFREKARLAQAAGARGLVVADAASASPPRGSLIRPGLRIPAVAAGPAALELRGPRAARGRHGGGDAAHPQRDRRAARPPAGASRWSAPTSTPCARGRGSTTTAAAWR